MKALILNSGIGHRMGELTRSSPKALVRLYNGETIFSRQLRILSEFGIRDFVVTTGPFPEMIEAEAYKFEESGCVFSFVANPEYESTNYIYSIYLARNLLDDDIVMLHGDLVFSRQFAMRFMSDSRSPICATSAATQQNKDFKARMEEGTIQEISVDLDPASHNALQPIYKLDASTVNEWLSAISAFVEGGRKNVYAEEALNTVLRKMRMSGFDYGSYYVAEVDDVDDLQRVSRDISAADWDDQPIYAFDAAAGFRLMSGVPPLRSEVKSLLDILVAYGVKKPMVVASSNCRSDAFANLAKSVANGVTFRDYSPNPDVSEVSHAVDRFYAHGCDGIVSIGGGSAIDVAKAAKEQISKGAHACFNGDRVKPYHIAIPTTAGTGSESTHFAAIYEDGIKGSVEEAKLLPDCVVLSPGLLASLPAFQRRCTMLDALCQSVESIWSRSSMAISRLYASKSIGLITDHALDYVEGVASSWLPIMIASNLSGKAINITKTTAPHALSYRMTSLFGIPHGLSVALCMPHVWELTVSKANELSDEERDELLGNMSAIQKSFRGKFAYDGIRSEGFSRLRDSILGDFDPMVHPAPEEVADMTSAVNEERLANHPVAIDREDVRVVYEKVFA